MGQFTGFNVRISFSGQFQVTFEFILNFLKLSDSLISSIQKVSSSIQETLVAATFGLIGRFHTNSKRQVRGGIS